MACLDPAARVVRWDASWFVKPALDPVLTAFCTELTHIAQADVDGGLPLGDALDALMARLDRPCVFSSWGYYDRLMFESNCERYGIAYPFENHFSLKAEFATFFRRPPVGMAGALKRLKMPLVGTHHRGLDDARNIASIAVRMLELGWTPPPIQVARPTPLNTGL